MRVKRESEIEAELRERVERRGGICVKVKTTGRRGFPDRLVIMPGGRVLFVELKRPQGGVVSIHQGEWLAQLHTLAAVVAIVRCSADIDALSL